MSSLYRLSLAGCLLAILCGSTPALAQDAPAKSDAPEPQQTKATPPETAAGDDPNDQASPRRPIRDFLDQRRERMNDPDRPDPRGPAERGMDERGPGERSMGERGPGERNWGPGNRRPGGRSYVSSDEWADAIAFLEAHSPNRLALYKQVEERADSNDNELLRSMRQRIFRNIQPAMQAKQRDLEVAPFLIRQIEIQDEIFGLVRNDDPERRTKVRALLREYVENSLNEREARVNMLRKRLDDEQAQIERDRGRMDELVREHAERFREDYVKRFERVEEMGGPLPEPPKPQ